MGLHLFKSLLGKVSDSFIWFRVVYLILCRDFEIEIQKWSDYSLKMGKWDWFTIDWIVIYLFIHSEGWRWKIFQTWNFALRFLLVNLASFPLVSFVADKIRPCFLETNNTWNYDSSWFIWEIQCIKVWIFIDYKKHIQKWEGLPLTCLLGIYCFSKF